jgi:hypothetical protein
MALVLRRRLTGEILLAAGGRWDRIERRFINERPPRARVIDLEESQVEFVRWFAAFLRDLREGRPRGVSVVLAAGDRRGGKTFALMLCAVALLIDVPSIASSATVGWAVSASYQERDEIDKLIQEQIPRAWYTPRKAPEYRYIFAHGSTLRNVSANDPETLRRGRVDVAVYNEAQKIPLAGLVNGVMGTADKGGIALLAANPPRRTVGEWVRELKIAVEEKRVEGVLHFGFSSKDNTQIDQPAKSRVGQIVRLLDPRAAQADDEGLWLPVGDRAYPKWSQSLIGEPPAYRLREITEQLLYEMTSVSYQFVAGGDFQGRPHQAAAILRVFEGENGPIYWFVDELLVEGTEYHLSDAAHERGYTPESMTWIADASGEWQNAKHNSAGGTSFDVLRSQRWNVQGPTEVQRPDRSRYSKNPDIDRRLGLVYLLMEQGRLRVDPRCAWLIESFEKCPLGENRYGRRRPYGKHAHVTDAAGYPLWFLEPKPGETGGWDASDIRVVRARPRPESW